MPKTIHQYTIHINDINSVIILHGVLIKVPKTSVLKSIMSTGVTPDKNTKRMWLEAHDHRPDIFPKGIGFPPASGSYLCIAVSLQHHIGRSTNTEAMGVIASDLKRQESDTLIEYRLKKVPWNRYSTWVDENGALFVRAMCHILTHECNWTGRVVYSFKINDRVIRCAMLIFVEVYTDCTFLSIATNFCNLVDLKNIVWITRDSVLPYPETGVISKRQHSGEHGNIVFVVTHACNTIYHLF